MTPAPCHACRFCGTPLQHTFADLGSTPPSNAYLREEDLLQPEPVFPLRAYVCEKCFLVQLPQFQSPQEIFSNYAYFSSYSDSWLRHVEAYAHEMVVRLELNSHSQVVEIASNDGYLLQYFVAQGIPVLGVEPAANVAAVAKEKGIPSLVRFFGVETANHLAATGKRADLLLGNNVLAHVPGLKEFVAGLKIALKPQGVVTMEFPHLMRLMAENQFDTIYHEHFSYFSLNTVRQVFDHHQLTIFDVDELPTHGGSLRIYARHEEDLSKPVETAIADLLATEQAAGLERLETYLSFGEQVERTKQALIDFLTEAKRQGQKIVGYGAPAKGNTLLNYCGVGADILDYTVDRSPHKQGHFLPGTHLPIFSPDKLEETKPDLILVLPWNLKEEILQDMAHVRDWGARFVTAIPEISVS